MMQLFRGVRVFVRVAVLLIRIQEIASVARYDERFTWRVRYALAPVIELDVSMVCAWRHVEC
jgi:hypothetical protein